MNSTIDRHERNIWGVIGVYLIYLAGISRVFAWIDDPIRLPRFLVFEIAFLILMSWMIWIPTKVEWLHHLCLLIEVIIVVGLELLAPEEDFANVLFILIGYQVGLLFRGRDFWVWAVSLLFVTWFSLVITEGLLEGTAKSLLNVAGAFIVMAYFLASRDVNRARRERESMLKQLQESNQKLKMYTTQVEELTTLDERNRLARELHDSVSQTLFSITLNTRAAQMLLKKKPGKLKAQLEKLQQLTEGALAEIRTMITQLRPH